MPQLPSEDVHLPLLDFSDAPNLEDMFDIGIGDADPAFVDSQEVDIMSCRSSSCDEIDDEESEDHEESEDDELREDNEDFFDAAPTLEDLLWPAELLYNPEQLARDHRGQKWHRQGERNDDSIRQMAFGE
jgi:hypothetical protein